jgi:hypothetical protein
MGWLHAEVTLSVFSYGVKLDVSEITRPPTWRTQVLGRDKVQDDERFFRRVTEVFDILLRVSETRAWTDERETTLRHIRLICRRAESDLFGNPGWVASIRPEIVTIFPELFRLQSQGVFNQRSHASLHALIWVRESLTKLCSRFEKLESSTGKSKSPQIRKDYDMDLLNVSWRAFL